MTKHHLIFVFMLLFSVAFGEVAAQKVKVGKDFSVSIERTPCRGTCPAFKMSIDRKGNVQYEGIRGVKNVGKFHKKLTKAQLKAIISVVEKAKYFTFADKYDKEGVVDVPSCTFTYKNNGKAKSIFQRMDIPEALTNMTATVEKMVGEEGYVK